VVNRRSIEQRLCHQHVRNNVAVCYLELNAPKKSKQFNYLIVFDRLSTRWPRRTPAQTEKYTERHFRPSGGRLAWRELFSSNFRGFAPTVCKRNLQSPQVILGEIQAKVSLKLLESRKLCGSIDPRRNVRIHNKPCNGGGLMAKMRADLTFLSYRLPSRMIVEFYGNCPI